MQPLGDPIGEGRTAEVYDLGDGRVLKLLKEGLPPGWLDIEADKTAAVHAAGAPAPGVHGVMEVGDRVGYVFDRAPGRKMLARIKRSPQRIRRWGRMLGEIHARILDCGCAELPDLKESLAWKIVRAEGLSSREKAAARDALTGLPDGCKVLHGDFHTNNVFVDGEDAVVIDWIDATCGDPAADIARTLWLLSPEVIPPAGMGRRAARMLAEAARTAYLGTILPAAGRTRTDVAAWRLPVLAGRLSEGIAHEQQALVREVRSLIRD
ncbi:MAG: phosphotransferase [Actinobacteria bacterium]|nr:phosphotransferase [Actinomycetota bacterium]